MNEDFILSVYDILLPPIYVLIIYVIATYIKKKKEWSEPIYRYYVKGLLVKIVGAIALCLIYQFYYSGGDTTNYFITAKAIANVLSKNGQTFISIMEGNNTIENFSIFDGNTGYPVYWRDSNSVFVSRLLVPFFFVSGGSFITCAILLASICYSGIWKLFLLFTRQFPEIEKQLAISILFVPSVVFWGSGILKDTITLSAACWYVYYFYYFFIKKNRKISYIVYVLISAYIIISIKPYILFALLPGSVIWLSNEQLLKIKNKVIRIAAAPLFLTIGISIGFITLSQMDKSLGDYSLDKVLDKAVVSNQDQKQAYYGGHSFDIGDFDANLVSVLGKSHLAIAATLFRPYLWDVKNPVMLISALENTYIMILTIFLLIRLKILGFFTLINKNPLLLFSVLFALFFAFSVGIATSNFGSLVRLKIPCIPFFVSSLFILRHFYEKKTKKN